MKKDEPKMKETREEKIQALEKMLRNAPDIMSPQIVSQFAPFGISKVYEIIKTKELKAYRYSKTHIIAKSDFIEYLADHSEDDTFRRLKIQEGGSEQ